jgi:DNA-directed RNA polymerase alpha subunit
MNDEHYLRHATAGPATAVRASSEPGQLERKDAAWQANRMTDAPARQRGHGAGLPSPAGDFESLSRRTSEALASAGIDGWNALRRSSPNELLRIRDFGPACLAEVREEMAARDLRLRGDC